jgi:hypothetical protein
VSIVLLHRAIVRLSEENRVRKYLPHSSPDSAVMTIGVRRNLGWGCSLSSVTAELRARSRAGGGCGRGPPPLATGVRAYNPGKFLKIQMLAGEF